MPRDCLFTIVVSLTMLLQLSASEEADRIVALPGQPPVGFQQFSGYVTVDKAAGRALFYWLTEAVENPSTRPLVVWLNGAKDSLQFLIQWLNRFPCYKNREVYLTGESYAGHYVPQLAREIVNYNVNAKHKINLKGFMVGNPETDKHFDNIGNVNYLWSHAMISDKTYKHYMNTCDFQGQTESKRCMSLFNAMYREEVGYIDQYNIYAPLCHTGDSPTRHTMLLPHRPHSDVYRQLKGYDPCIENYAEIYYNRADVQKALHANISGHIPYKWALCSDTLMMNWADRDSSILPIYRELIGVGLRIWVYSGDVDSVMPVTETRYSLAQLKLDTIIEWYPWYIKDEVGGWTEVYKGVTFATVRGAGHDVPMFKPRAAFQLFTSFLQGKPLPR